MTLRVEAPTQPEPVPATKRSRRLVVVGVGVLTALGLGAALTLPVVLDGRHSSATTTMRAQLHDVATAQSAWKADHGTYTTRLEDLGLEQSGGDLAIVSADEGGFCAGAYDPGTRATVFYSPADGFSDEACG